MALEFEAAAAAPTPPFSISGTPYYFAMFNAAGDNVGDTNVKRNIGAGFDTIEFKSPNRTNTPWGFNCADVLNDSTFGGQLTYGTFLMDAGAAQFGTRLKLDSGTSGYISLETSVATQVPIIDLFDYQHTKHAYLKNDDGLKFVSTDGAQVQFLQDTTADHLDIIFGLDRIDISAFNTTAAYTLMRIESDTALIIASNADETNAFLAKVESGATNTHVALFNDSVLIFGADSTGIITGAPTGVDAVRWKLGEAVASTPTPDTSIYVEVAGVVYKIAAEEV